MKTQTSTLLNRTGILSALLLFFFSITTADACDWCNNKFFGELNSSRSGSIVSEELLKSIRAQHDFDALAAEANNFANNAAAQISARSDATDDFIDIIRRDNRLKTRPTGYVPQDTKPDVRISITLAEGEVYIGNGVMYEGFTIDGGIPGPTITVQEGDVVEFTIVNAGNIYHGASIHSAYTQTSKYLGKIAPRDSSTVVFRANQPGVYMYHCAPGGHAIPMHVIMGQYGMMIVEPKKKFKLEEELGRKPDIELNITQHEYYASGKDAVTGQGNPIYTTFNGKLFRYVEEPIMARPGDYVRLNFLNVGPNLLSTFHIVGIIWDYAYWQGNPENVLVGGQSITAGPSDSWTVEFRIPPDEGAYTMLTHAVGSASRGAIGLIMAKEGAERSRFVDQQGPIYTDEELADYKERSVRTINSSGIGSPEIDVPQVYADGTEEVIVKIIGNSFYPKVIDIKPGTKVTWVNEDVFSYMEGEFSGIHNVVAIKGPVSYASPLLSHGEKYSYTFSDVGEYNYICTPHPYMKGMVRVSEATQVASSFGANGLSIIALLFGLLGFVIAIVAVRKKGSAKA